MNQEEVNELRAERLAKTHDPLALMAKSQNSYNYPVFHLDYPSQITYMQQPLPNNNYIPQPSFNQNYMQQPMLNPEDISDPTTAMNMALIAQPCMNMGQDRQMQMVVVQNIGKQFVPNADGNSNVVATRAEGNGNGNNKNQTQLLIAQKEEAGIQLQAKEFDLMVAAGDIDEIEEVNANCILMANLQQASTLGTQTDKAPGYDSDGPAENDSNVISAVSSMEHSGGMEEQNPTTIEETRAFF
ncbi:hypothetical protein Tco_1293033 [Tanacetum coccineum]